MKIQLDTTNKTIKIEEDVNLNMFFDKLEELLPNGKWKKFKLVTQVIVNWSNPVIVEPYNPNIYPWWKQPWISYDNSETNYTLNSGVYNIEW